ncbi:MAG: sulfatase [Verrucomicrobia bacterium]|mgnify:FL=1|nr:sulfatase [Verrucomicrobiota bacterium]
MTPILARVLRFHLTLLCGCATLLETHAADTPASAKPNVLFIAIDDLRPELGCYGNQEVKTPHLDQLASTGLRFDRAYTQYAICGPSRACMLTGLRPDTLKIEEIDTFFRNTVPDVVTLPQHFKANGYTSLYVGKVFHAGQTDDAISWSHKVKELPKGQEYKLPESIATAKKRREESEARYGRSAQLQGMGAGPAWEGADAGDSEYPDGRTADAAIATLRELKGKPFFLGVGFVKPHQPFVAPKKYFDLYDPAKLTLTDTPNPPQDAPSIARHSSFELRTRTLVPTSGPIDEGTSRELLRAYYACASFVDAQIGRVLAELDALGLRENTIIVVWGDHGWHLGEYGIWGKATNYEVATRAPLIVSAPTMAAQGKGTRALVEFVDVYPTLCELAHLPVPQALEGKSFVPLLTDPEQKWKGAALSQFPSPALREWAARPLSPAMRGTYFGPVIEAVEARLKQEHGARYDADLFNNHLMGYSIRTDRYRYTAWLDRRDPSLDPLAEELYDHETDPHETVNVAKVNPEITQAHLKQLRAQLK